MLWAVYCVDKPGTAAARSEHLKEHRAYLDKAETHIFFSGPLQSDDAEAQVGSLFILNVGSREEAQAFVDNEPFHNVGIFQQVSIFRMKKMRYNPHLVDVI